MSIIKADQVNVVSDKVKLTKEQAEFLEEKASLYGKSTVVEYTAKKKWVEGSSLYELTLDKIIRALYIGHEEQTPECKLKEHFECQIGYDSNYNGSKEEINAFQAGIITSLEILDIKVKGINS